LHGLSDHGQKTEAVQSCRRVVMIDHDAIKEPVDRLTQATKRLHYSKKLVTGLHLRAGLRQRAKRRMKSGFGILDKQVWV
jgi:hypothetical protein